MYKIDAEVILYDNVDDLDFCTSHPYWLSINGYVVKISKRTCNELKYMHRLDEEVKNKEKNIAYLCDMKECENGHCDICHHTLNIEHAVNFEKLGDGKYMEIDRYNEVKVSIPDSEVE